MNDAEKQNVNPPQYSIPFDLLGGHFGMDTAILLVLAGTAVCCLILFLRTPAQRKLPFAKHPDAASQLRHVMAASFYKKKIMNKSEYRVFKVVESEVSSLRKGYRVLSQTSLGEIVGSSDSKAYFAVNSKRIDVLIIGPYGDAVAAIEYQGGGHHQGSAAARDAIKREALRKAGIQFIEVMEDHSNAEIIQMVRRVVQLPQVA